MRLFVNLAHFLLNVNIFGIIKDMNIFLCANKKNEDILKEYAVAVERGLSADLAEERLQKFGMNEVVSGTVAWWHVLARQCKSPFIYLLLAAAILAFFLGEIIDAAMIALFITINIFLGFYQEYRSEQTIKLLKKYVVPFAKARRDGEDIALKAKKLVPGDIIRLAIGDKIPADVRFIKTVDLKVDESILSGESIAVEKHSDIIKKEVKAIYQAANLGFSGTNVVSGSATAIVLKTGADTETGGIMRLSAQAKHLSSFEKGISRFSTFIIRLIGVTLLFVFLANVFLKKGAVSFSDMLIFSIALAVSVIPEALPLVMTFSFSRGALRLARKKVVVKRLSSIEDLGGIDVLCTDKTGTLTQNKLTVSETFTGDRKQAIFYANLNLAGKKGESELFDPFDIALFAELGKAEKKELDGFDRVADIPFSPMRRRNGVLIEKGGKLEYVLRGAPEEIFPLAKNLDPKKIAEMKDWIREQGKMGSRVLAVAAKKVIRYDLDKLEKLENNLEFIGIVSFTDPIKSTTKEAIQQAKALGVAIKIITGDSREVSGAVAYKIGLIKNGDEVMCGDELAEMNEADFKEAIERYSVFARISPQTKYKIIETLEQTHEVGFLGEGINDAPALKIANVSLVVESASDVAREVADIVLLKKDLKVIIEGIKDGREIFANTTKYIVITLGSNFGNFYAVAVASLIIDFLPMLPIQLLLVNLLSDFPMIAIATDNVDARELEAPKKYNIKDIVIIASILGVVSSIFDFIIFALFYKISPAVLQTNWFIGSILTELAFIYSMRTKMAFFKAKTPSLILMLLSVLAVLATISIPFTRLGQELFSFHKPSFTHLILIFSVVFVYFIVTEIVKLLYYRPAKK